MIAPELVIYGFIVTVLILVLLTLYEYGRSSYTLTVDERKCQDKMMAICQTYGIPSMPALSFLKSCHRACKKLSRVPCHNWEHCVKDYICDSCVTYETLTHSHCDGLPTLDISKNVTNEITIVYVVRISRSKCYIRWKYRVVACDPFIRLLHHDNYIMSSLIRIARWYGDEVHNFTHDKYTIVAKTCQDHHDYLCKETETSLDICCGVINGACMHITMTDQLSGDMI